MKVPDSNYSLRSFFAGGFECSTHRNRFGKRLDLVAMTGHDRHALADYSRLAEIGIMSARDGLRWHLIEREPWRYDFESVLPVLIAAREAGVQIIWDLCHYGWPDDLDIFSEAFIERFSGLCEAFARLLAAETDETPFISPINEISFFSWAAGDEGIFFPYGRERGDELKRQLVKASIAGIEAFWTINPQARIVHTDPVINVVARRSEEVNEAESYRLAQYGAWDMISGRVDPALGGAEKYLDIIGLNYYVHNQWFYPDREMISPNSQLYRPFRDILIEVHERYKKPIFIAETGVEDDFRPHWLRYVVRETRAAVRAGVPIEGICLYPIINHPGWEDDRHCHNGLWDYADESGERPAYTPLLGELDRQIKRANKYRKRWALMDE